MDILRREDVLSSQQLFSCSGFRHDESGPGLRHCSSPHVWPEKCLHPGYVSFSIFFHYIFFRYIAQVSDLFEKKKKTQTNTSTFVPGSKSFHGCWWPPLMVSSSSTMWIHWMEENACWPTSTGEPTADRK